jgi:G3E family GTPase
VDLIQQASDLQALKTTIRSVNPEAHIVETHKSKVDITSILTLGTYREAAWMKTFLSESEVSHAGEEQHAGLPQAPCAGPIKHHHLTETNSPRNIHSVTLRSKERLQRKRCDSLPKIYHAALLCYTVMPLLL